MVVPISEMHLLLLSIAMLSALISSYWIWQTKKSFAESNLNKFVKWLSFATFIIAVNLVFHFLLEITGFIKGEMLDYVLYIFFILSAFCFARASMYLDEVYKESDFMSLVKEKMQNQTTEEFFEEAKK
jgi:cytochrome bd-type quinol oxidase subunit 2